MYDRMTSPADDAGVCDEAEGGVRLEVGVGYPADGSPPVVRIRLSDGDDVHDQADIPVVPESLPLLVDTLIEAVSVLRDPTGCPACMLAEASETLAGARSAVQRILETDEAPPEGPPTDGDRTAPG